MSPFRALLRISPSLSLPLSLTDDSLSFSCRQPRGARNRVISLNGSVKKSSITPLMHTRTPPAHAQGIRSTRATCGSPQQRRRHRRRAYTCIIIYTAKKHHSPPATTPSKRPPPRHRQHHPTKAIICERFNSRRELYRVLVSYLSNTLLAPHHSVNYICVYTYLVRLITFSLHQGLSILYVYTLP